MIQLASRRAVRRQPTGTLRVGILLVAIRESHGTGKLTHAARRAVVGRSHD